MDCGNRRKIASYAGGLKRESAYYTTLPGFRKLPSEKVSPPVPDFTRHSPLGFEKGMFPGGFDGVCRVDGDGSAGPSSHFSQIAVAPAIDLCCRCGHLFSSDGVASFRDCVQLHRPGATLRR
jgi:hypothetical protein